MLPQIVGLTAALNRDLLHIFCPISFALFLSPSSPSSVPFLSPELLTVCIFRTGCCHCGMLRFRVLFVASVTSDARQPVSVLPLVKVWGVSALLSLCRTPVLGEMSSYDGATPDSICHILFRLLTRFRHI